MKSVLISINPKWCELIASGKKTVEVRKTHPKIEAPFKCYIYCTNDFADSRTRRKRSEFWIGEPLNNVSKGRYIGNGMVIGEFVCDTIFPISVTYSDPNSRLALREFPYTCLTDKQIIDYLGNGKRGYSWHISDLVIYDEPKDLDDFMAFGKTHCDQKNCGDCLYMGIDGICDVKDIGQPMTRPPQSWCYVEESKE